eukprot:768792-Hanusia_phi.AAC.12
MSRLRRADATRMTSDGSSSDSASIVDGASSPLSVVECVLYAELSKFPSAAQILEPPLLHRSEGARRVGYSEVWFPSTMVLGFPSTWKCL